jgi:hypothetical protein
MLYGKVLSMAREAYGKSRSLPMIRRNHLEIPVNSVRFPNVEETNRDQRVSTWH